MMQSGQRPKYLNLIQIRLPLQGIVSIAHRISGVLMFLAIPFMVYALHLSALDEAGFQQVLAIFDYSLVKLLMLLLVWSIFHHLFAGIRYLLIDADIGVSKSDSRFSAAIVISAGLSATLAILAVTLL